MLLLDSAAEERFEVFEPPDSRLDHGEKLTGNGLGRLAKKLRRSGKLDVRFVDAEPPPEEAKKTRAFS